MDIFKYDSPLSQALMKIADVMIINVLYLICCIPIFTIGAAQAGLYTAAKVMLDKEDDTSVSKAFFRGFKAGFGTITISWGLITLLQLVSVWMGVSAAMLGAPFLPVGIALVIITVYQTALPLFHSKFGGNFKMLMRNTLFFMFGFPLPCIGATILLWLPVIAAYFLKLYTYGALTPIWLFFYYSTAFLFSYIFAKKPFKVLVAEYNSGHKCEENAEDAEVKE